MRLMEWVLVLTLGLLLLASALTWVHGRPGLWSHQLLQRQKQVLVAAQAYVWARYWSDEAQPGEISLAAIESMGGVDRAETLPWLAKERFFLRVLQDRHGDRVLHREDPKSSVWVVAWEVQVNTPWSGRMAVLAKQFGWHPSQRTPGAWVLETPVRHFARDTQTLSQAFADAYTRRWKRVVV